MDQNDKTWTSVEEQNVKDDSSRLYGYLRQQEGKFQRNLNRYFNNGKGSTDSIWNIRNQVQGYQPTFYLRNGVQTVLNILKSCTDTIVSKISQAKVRPFFNSVRGEYMTIRACRNAQDFFDAFYDRIGMYKISPMVLRDALIFERGVWFIDDDEMTVKRVLPWNAYVDPTEFHYGGGKNLTRALLLEYQYPLTMVRQKYGDKSIEPGKAKGFAENVKRLLGISDWANKEHVDDFEIYYDLAEGKKYYLYGRRVFKVKDIAFKRSPFVFLFWTKPEKGIMTTSLIDELYTIQVQIDELQLRIDDATRTAMFNTVFVPKGSEVKETMLSNKAALVVEYMPGPTGGQPVVSTPPPLASEWRTLLNEYIQKAYEIAGISQLSAQGKKPAGLNSGVALDTFEDIESERFNVILQNYIAAFIEVADAIIDIFPEDADVLPKSLGRDVVKWKDIKKQRDMFNIQFSAGSALAKDPAKKLEQIQQLMAMGILPKEMVSQLLEIPDLEGAYSAANASYDYAQHIVQQVAETGNMDFAPVADLDMLFAETVRWLLRLSADEKNKKYVDNLAAFLQVIQGKQEEVMNEMTPPPPPAPPEPPAQDMSGQVPPAPPPVDGGMVPPVAAPQPNA